MKKTTHYYDFKNDIEAYPDCWCYLIIGGRNTGKTYSTLCYSLDENADFIYTKRTIEDVELLCSGSGKVGTKNEFGFNISPFNPINNDRNIDIQAHQIKKGLGAFYQHDSEGAAYGTPIGYLLGLSAVSKYKGFDFSSYKKEQLLIFDEFIPQPWDRVNRKEGEQLMDLYKTISRGREHKNLNPLRLVCLANATSISNPVMNVLEVTDIVAEMQAQNIEYIHLQDRGILIHLIVNTSEFDNVEKNSAIYKAMGNTAWGRMTFDNQFAYNDFSCIKRLKLKGYKPIISIRHKEKVYYLYQKNENYYFSLSPNEKSISFYDLNTETDQRRFYRDYIFELQQATIEHNMSYQEYTIYDLIMNYKQFFKM
ncbi:MAG: hypothetical protein KBT36_14840 [Kurthia sp.]|nr:hypothetical protein [Candidatus Kurthia equi]